MKIGSQILRNEFIMAPVKTGYSDGNGQVKNRHLNFYRERAKDIGAIIPEPFYLDKKLREIPAQMGIDHADKIFGLKKLTDVIHREGAKVIAHLNHPGRMANPEIPDNKYFSSTAKPCENGGAKPRRMTKIDINNVIDLFKHSAVRAKKANFDFIELQFGHGYLVTQFLSPKVNNRKDEYGGSFKNRIRLAREILAGVKEEVDLPVIIRISGDEMIEEGIKLPEMKRFARILEGDNADAIHVSAGSICSTPPWYFQHMFVPKGKTWGMAKEIKAEVNIPVITVGKINEFKDIDKIKKEKMADFIALGRPMVADPDFITKYLNKNDDYIRPCLACTAGCLGGVKSGKGLECLVNPDVENGSATLKPAEKSKKYAVVGGGLAGMESALTLKKRGHEVVVFEKDKLGGQFNLAFLPPGKSSLKKLITYYKQKMKVEGIEIKYRSPEKEELVGNYDGIILATGAEPVAPPISGLESIDYYWADILKEENIPENKNVFIIGGGLIGVDIATGLIEKNNKVTIVKRTTDFGEDMEMLTKKLFLAKMKEKNVVFSDHTYIQKIEDNTVYALRNEEEIQFNNIDVFVVSTGMKSNDSLKDILEEEIQVYLAGDAKKPGNAQQAIASGYQVAKSYDNFFK